MNLFTFVLPLSEDKRVGEGRPAGSDVDGASTGKVKGRQVVEPSVAVPGPASDWAVDDSRPAECEDHGGKDTATLERTTFEMLVKSSEFGVNEVTYR